MKHENNFFLYALGSAFLLVFGMALVSGTSFEQNQSLVANTITASASVENKKSDVSTHGYLYGTVFEDKNKNEFFDKGKDMPLFNREVFLWKLEEGGESLFVKTAFTDEQGAYSFEIKTPGNYFIKIIQSEEEIVIYPLPTLEGFAYPSHAKFVQIMTGDHYYAGIDFAITKK